MSEKREMDSDDSTEWLALRLFALEEWKLLHWRWWWKGWWWKRRRKEEE